MTETLVICAIVDGFADTTIVHHPADHKLHGGKGQIPIRFDSRTWPPRTWPSLCGSVDQGYVYAHAGLLEHAPVCAGCEFLATAAIEA